MVNEHSLQRKRTEETETHKGIAQLQRRIAIMQPFIYSRFLVLMDCTLSVPCSSISSPLCVFSEHPRYMLR